MQNLQEKQKYLRDNLQAEDYENFADFFMNEVGEQNIDIDKYSFEQVKLLVDKFKAAKDKEQRQQSHERSFANYQTAADLQQAYSIVSAIKNSQNSQPLKPGQKSATDLLDSVFEQSQSGSSCPSRSPPEKMSLEGQQRSSSKISAFQSGNIWATTSNVQTQRKSVQFQSLWQFPTTSNVAKKQQFRTENPFSSHKFEQLGNGSNHQQHQQSNMGQFKKPQSVPSFDQLTKKTGMSKKPITYTSGQVQKPSSMKKSESPVGLTGVNTQPTSNVQNLSNNQPKQSRPVQDKKQIKLVSQMPLVEPNYQGFSTNNSAVNNSKGNAKANIKLPSSNMGSAYKMNKVAYQGPTVHKSEFRDAVKCYEATYRAQLGDNRLQIVIQKHQIVERNFFVSDYVIYYLTIKPLNLVCKRNYQDFTKLRAALEKFYPGVQLPYLEKNSWFQTNVQNVKKQKTMLQFFLSDLVRNAQIRNSRVFQDFLTLKQHKAIKRKFQEYAKMDEYKGLEQLCVLGGKVDVVLNQTQRIYHEQLGKIIDQFQDLLGKKNKLIQVLGSQFTQVNQTLCNLSKVSAQLGEQVKKFNQRVNQSQIPSLQNTFNIVAKSYEQWASRINFESKVVTKRLVPFYKYQSENLSTLKSLLATHNSLFKSYVKRQAGEKPPAQTYTSTSLKPFKNGVLLQSKNITVLKYQLGYTSNLVCKQTARFFELMSQNFKAKWIYQAQKYSERLNKDMQFYASVSAMAK